MTAIHRVCAIAMMVIGIGMAVAAPPAALAPRAAPPAALADAGKAASGEDKAAILTYDLAKISRWDDGHRYLTLHRGAKPSRGCPKPLFRSVGIVPDGGYEYRTICLQVKTWRREVLAGRVTRLTLIWSAHRARMSDIEVQIAANGHRRYDWLRPSGNGGSRRLSLEIPALDVRRLGGLRIQIVVAARAAGEDHRTGKSDAVAEPFVDGLELELL